MKRPGAVARPPGAGTHRGPRTPRVRSFAPVGRADAHTLILGSMPGVASLRAQQYYAHPLNQFWPLMGEIFGAGPLLPYAARLERLQQQGVALWDVLRSCVRRGSLDAAIEQRSAVVNDLPAWLAEHPRIERLCCNGALAHAALHRHFAGTLTRCFGDIRIVRLPSTSPANAVGGLPRKLEAWRAALSRA